MQYLVSHLNQFSIGQVENKQAECKDANNSGSSCITSVLAMFLGSSSAISSSQTCEKLHHFFLLYQND